MEEITFPEEKFAAVYDSETGRIKHIGPDWAFSKEKYKIPVEKEFVELINSGEIKIFKCFVDFESGNLKIAETETIIKMDDILHRISLNTYSDISNPDIYITYNIDDKKILIELNKELGGTKHFEQQRQVKRNIIWDGDTTMNFYITSFNDPHILFDIISVKIEDLKENFFEKTYLEFPANFSIYTRRLLKNYVCEII